jgi:hypothetical protein
MANDVERVFARKNVAEIRNFLRHHAIDVNECTLLWSPDSLIYSTTMKYAMYHFDPDVIQMLLKEFGADLNAPCHVERVNGFVAEDDYLIFQIKASGDTDDILEFLLDHGASAFILEESSVWLSNPRYGFCRLLLTARDRTRVAWAAHWALSQHLVWRDMAQQVAQHIMATPVREFLNESVDQNKKENNTRIKMAASSFVFCYKRKWKTPNLSKSASNALRSTLKRRLFVRSISRWKS